jgi:Protein of unknown function (DUF2868).
VSDVWTIADLIDYHYFSRMDDELRRTDGETALADRDRAFYLAEIAPLMEKGGTVAPRILVRKWLTMRRAQYRLEQAAEGMSLPGTVWSELTALCFGTIFVCGLFIGICGAGSLLLYTGKTPLNVSVYFGLFVLLQVVILALQGFMLGCRRLRRMSIETSVVYLFLGRVLMRTFDGVRRWLQSALTGHQRLDLAAVFGSVRQRKELAALLIWPAFALVQLGGIGFNLGVIGVTLGKVIFADIAFAWQSSLQLSPDVVAGLVQWIALPWSWCLPEAVPTLAQIRGSQMVLKEGIVLLETANLVAWWPFLCCAVLVYGLLPRCLLLILGLVRQRRALSYLDFASLDFRLLVQRMTTPRIDTNGFKEEERPEGIGIAASGPAAVGSDCSRPQIAPFSQDGHWVLLVPDELDEETLRVDLVESVRAEFGIVPECRRYGVPGMTDAAILASPTVTDAAPLAGVLVLHEAWQPPLKETEGLVRLLRHQISDQTPISILLIGRPASRTVLTPVDPEQAQIWSRKMQAVGDPYLSVCPLVRP